MTKKEIFLIALVGILGAVYVFCFTELVRKPAMRIEHSARPLREAWSGGGQRVDPAGKRPDGVTFALHADYRLTSVQVVAAAEWETNKQPHRYWHLVCRTGTPPVNAICYGVPIRGMTPAVPGAAAELLKPGVEYRLLVEAGSVRGTNNFQIAGSPATRK